MSTSTPQITDAAREAANKEVQHNFMLSPYPKGHFVQQLLDAERDRIAAEYALMLEERTSQLRQQLTEAQAHYKDELVEEFKEQARLINERDEACSQLLEHKAAIAMKDEALRKLNVCNCSYYERSGDHSPHCSKSIADQALSPNCGQPLLELVREMKAALDKLARLGNEPNFGNSKGNDIARAALTKAKQLGF